VRSIDDGFVEGDEDVHVIFAVVSGPAEFASAAAQSASITVKDDDVAGYTRTPDAATIVKLVEGGAAVSVHIRLDADPTAPVTITPQATASAGVTVGAAQTVAAGTHAADLVFAIRAKNDTTVGAAHRAGVVSWKVTTTDPAFAGIALSDTKISTSEDDEAAPRTTRTATPVTPEPQTPTPTTPSSTTPSPNAPAPAPIPTPTAPTPTAASPIAPAAIASAQPAGQRPAAERSTAHPRRNRSRRAPAHSSGLVGWSSKHKTASATGAIVVAGAALKIAASKGLLAALKGASSSSHWWDHLRPNSRAAKKSMDLYRKRRRRRGDEDEDEGDDLDGSAPGYDPYGNFRDAA
jgi:hypothetical protein